MLRIGHGEKAADHLSGGFGRVWTAISAEKLEHVAADQGAGLGRKMGGAGHAHRGDRCRSEPGGIAGARGTAQGAALAAEGSPGAASHENEWVLLEIPAATVPKP